jgi:hypothetical protein
MESRVYSDMKHTHLCQGVNVINSSQGHRNAFSLVMDQVEVSTISCGNPETH